MKRSEDQQKEADKLYDLLRDELMKRDLSNTENYDKSILTLSASSLGLSLTAVKYIIDISKAEYLWSLYLGWCLLVISVGSSLIAYLISNHAISIQLTNARDYYKRGIEDAFSRDNIYISINKIINKVTGALFFMAIVSIVMFIAINLKKV